MKIVISFMKKFYFKHFHQKSLYMKACYTYSYIYNTFQHYFIYRKWHTHENFVFRIHIVAYIHDVYLHFPLYSTYQRNYFNFITCRRIMQYKIFFTFLFCWFILKKMMTCFYSANSVTAYVYILYIVFVFCSMKCNIQL